ncbi:MAG: hypothetical protein H0X66_09855 [Verrucomicrobia bacterium]|nr:hypothetical protein [Verrucomicrobiota bacterium]
MNPETLQLLLKTCAIAQFAIALLNLILVRMMGWRSDVERMPLLIREVFHVHSWFVSATLIIFAVVTWRFSSDFANANHEVFQWLAVSIGLFWAFRTVLQVVYYSASHWRGQPGRIVIHILLLIIYGGFAATYLIAALQTRTGGGL